MTLTELLDLWKVDSKIDPTDLSKESERLYDLHSRYLDLWSNERMKLYQLKLQLKRLVLLKHEHYIQGPSPETKHWHYPASGRVMRDDLRTYTDADKELQEMNLRIENCQVKVDALQSIIEAIKSRNFTLGNMIKREIFMGGV